MWRTLTLLALLGAASAAQATDFDQPVAALTPEGQAHWVVTCAQQDVCFQAAYQFCRGPYAALDRQFIPRAGLHFICKQPTAETTPHPASLQN
jgi:hypothetical protein